MNNGMLVWRNLILDLMQKNKKLLFWLTFIIVLVFSFLVRAFYANRGLPYIHNWDEPQIASTALNILKTGDFNPHFFNYGTLMIYLNYFVDIFHYLSLMGKPEGTESYLTNLSDIQINKDTGWNWTISHPSFYFWNKMLTVFLGTGTVVFTYLVSKNVLGNKWLGLLSAAFLGVLPFHITQSAMITTDAPAAFFVIVCIYYSLVFIDRGCTKYLITSLVFCGLAAATKYNSALAVLLPVLTIGIRYFIDKENFKSYWLALLPLVPMVTFFIAMPYAFIEATEFLKGIGTEVRHYKVIGHPGATSQPGLEHIYFQLDKISGHIGTVASIATCVGVLGVFIRPKLILALIVPVFFFFYMTQMTVNFHRNFVQVYPFISILFASSGLVLYEIMKWISSRLFNTNKKILLYIISLVFIGFTGYMAYESWLAAVSVKNTIETRSKAILEVNDLSQVTNVFIAKELRVHKQDLKKLKWPYKIKSIEEMKKCLPSDKGVILMLPTNVNAFYKGEKGGKYQRTMQANNDLLSTINKEDKIKNIGYEKQLLLDKLSVNPGILIAKMGSVYLCSHPEGNIPSGDMLFSRQFPIGKDREIRMYWNGVIKLPLYHLEAGIHLLRIEHKGKPANGVNAKMVVTVSDSDNASVINSYSFHSRNEYSFENILLDIIKVGNYRIEIAYVNDYKNTKEDRTAFVKSIYLHSFNNKSDGIPWNSDGNLIIKDKTAFEVDNIKTKEISISLDQNDQYDFCIGTKQNKIPVCKVFGPSSGPGGLKNYNWKLKQSMLITSIVVRPLSGDNSFSIGHIRLK